MTPFANWEYVAPEMVAREPPAGMTAVVLPPSTPGPDTSFRRSWSAWTLRRVHRHRRGPDNDIELPVLNRPGQAGATVGDQDDLEGDRIVSVASFAMCSSGAGRKPRSRPPPIRQLTGRRSAWRDNVEAVIVWASLTFERILPPRTLQSYGNQVHTKRILR